MENQDTLVITLVLFLIVEEEDEEDEVVDEIQLQTFQILVTQIMKFVELRQLLRDEK